jgi:transposase
MSPLVRRSWAPRGVTPILHQRTRRREKVSTIAALCVAPTRDRIHLYFRLHPDANINSETVIEFLRHLRRQLKTPAVLLWDHLQPHCSKKTGAFLHSVRHLHRFFFPGYAPELPGRCTERAGNPVENVWGYLKRNPLSNWAPDDLQALTTTARSHSRSIQRKQNLLRSFVKHSPLPLRLR